MQPNYPFVCLILFDTNNDQILRILYPPLQKNPQPFILPCHILFLIFNWFPNSDLKTPKTGQNPIGFLVKS